MTTLRPPFSHAAIAIAALLSACAVGPDYRRPEAPVPPAYKEAPQAGATWLPAVPADTLSRGDWWRLFGDAELDALVSQVVVSNQNVAAAVAAYAQARALVREQRAGLFPQASLAGSGRRSGGDGGSGNSVSALSNGFSSSSVSNSFQLSADVSWAPDIWGRLSRAVEGARASAQASEADLASATLSAQGELATDYFSLRDADTELGLLRSTVDAFERALNITQNRYDAAIAPRTDVLQAQTQLAGARADLVVLTNQRAQLEHAIAVLVGQPAGSFSVPVAEWNVNVPAVPIGLPSELLQRRPDIASAERSVAAANAQIGIAVSGYFPSLTLTGSYGTGGSRFGDLFNASTNVWSFGASVAQTLFDAGATSARVQEAEASRDAAVARYRQSVLAAFQTVENQLSATRYLAEEAGLRRVASEAADLTEQQQLNRYKAGQVSYTDVVTAQTSALSARRTLSQLASNRQAAAIGLIQALGGGWASFEPVAGAGGDAAMPTAESSR